MRLLTSSIILIGLSITLLLTPAQAAPSTIPIIGTDSHTLYAIDPETGDTRLLHQFDADQLQALTDAQFHYDFAFDVQTDTLCCLSPDGRYLAFTQPIMELIPSLDRLDGLYEFPNNIYWVEPSKPASSAQALSNQTTDRDTLMKSGKAVYYDMLTWSLDAKRLYAIENKLDLRSKRGLDSRIVYFDVATKRLTPFARLNPSDDIDGMYAIEDGLFIRAYLDRDKEYYRYTTYGSTGQVIHTLDINESQNIKLYGLYNTVNNPLLTDRGYRYALYSPWGCGLLTLLDPHDGTFVSSDQCYDIANISRLAPTTSLRLTLVKNNGFMVLAISDVNQTRLDEAEAGIPWLYGLSPDGQSVAYIEPDSADSTLLFIWHAGQTRQLKIPYPITSITWSPLDNIAVPNNSP